MDPLELPSPMLARLSRELPVGAGWSYEPKWDGFRCLAAVRGTEVELLSRHGRPFARYFPEIAEALFPLGAGSALDGELVISTGNGLDFEALLARLHPAASRVARLRWEAPASFVAFDLLADRGAPLATEPFVVRRARLEALVRYAGARVTVTPATRDPEVARGWLARPPGRGIDGVVAKPDALSYQPGKRAMTKVKALHTVDCVVAGLRAFPGDGGVASLLLGLWDGPALRHVGVVASFPAAVRRELLAALAPRGAPLAGHPWERGFNVDRSPIGRLGGSAGRWDPATMALDWTPLRADLVCEVAFDQLDGARFRHPAQLVRWRPDRLAASCTIEQLAPTSMAWRPAHP